MRMVKIREYSNFRYDLKIQRFKSTKKFIYNKGIILHDFNNNLS